MPAFPTHHPFENLVEDYVDNIKDTFQPRQRGWKPVVPELLELLLTFQEAGADVTDTLNDFEDALERVEALGAHPTVDFDVLTADREQLRDYAAARLAAGSDVAAALRDELAVQVAEKLVPLCDGFIENMRPDFDAAFKTVQAAAKAGITAETKGDELLLTGTDTQIKAWRALPEAVTKLNKIAAARLRVDELLPYGVIEHDGAAFVTGLTNKAELERADNIYRGTLRYVQLRTPQHGFGMAKKATHRHGGAWLEFALSPYEIHLNTGPETVEVVNNAKAGSK